MPMPDLDRIKQAEQASALILTSVFSAAVLYHHTPNNGPVVSQEFHVPSCSVTPVKQ
jgi:hypothetical protein